MLMSFAPILTTDHPELDAQIPASYTHSKKERCKPKSTLHYQSGD